MSSSSSPPMVVADIIMDTLRAVRNTMAYLHNPPPSSWVTRIAAAFRALALLTIIPCIFLTALDIASYLIVRTLGADSAHQSVDSTGTPSTVRYDKSGSSDVLITSSAAVSISHDHGPSDDKPPADNMKDHRLHSEMVVEGAESESSYFSTSSDASSSALSGEGLFSPPISRSSSPPILRHTLRTTNCLMSPEDGEDGGSTLRKRV